MPHFDINYIISKQGKESKGFLSLFSLINIHATYDSDLYHRQDILLIAILIVYSYWADG